MRLHVTSFTLVENESVDIDKYVLVYLTGDVKSVKIPLKIDALGYAPNSMKIGDLMEILKGCVQRQIHEMARSVLSEFKMRQTVSVPQAFHLYPRYKFSLQSYIVSNQ